jgi:protein-arginine kinase activator protein McsA
MQLKKKIESTLAIFRSDTLEDLFAANWGSCPNCGRSKHVDQLGSVGGKVGCNECYQSLTPNY